MTEQVSFYLIKNRPAVHTVNYTSNVYWKCIEKEIRKLIQWFVGVCDEHGDVFGVNHTLMRHGLKYRLPYLITHGLAAY